MKVGLCLPNYGKAAGKDAIERTASLAEKLDYDSVWTADHLLIAEEFASPYGKVLESLVTLSYVAARTENLMIGTGVIVFPMRETILLAKQVVALQILSDERLALGLGSGWNETEFRNVRADFGGRGQFYDEGIQLLRWLMKGNVEFKGDYYSITDGIFDPIPSKPIPIYIGGNGGPSLRRAAKLGDGWFPVGLAPEDLLIGRKRLSKLTERNMSTLMRMTVRFSEQGEAQTRKDPNGRTTARLSGTVPQIIRQIEDYDRVGLDHLICYFGDVVLESLEEAIARFGREIIPSL
ncbi:MAG: TIGR03619 family F420-dependent LLM class oxidoreductase [Thaumarchaeota archaeon]|nr:TIGR03619 family F420-dependent LLM class oxidoreductase [Nitrososphaerota archaeon]